VHIDGYVAVVAHTYALGEKGTIKGRQADAVNAAVTAAECCLRLLKPGNKNTQLTEVISKVATEFNCNPIRGVQSHQLLKFNIDAEKVIANRNDPDQKTETIEFQPNEVYAIDIVMSTGDGKPNEIDERTTIYKRAADTTYKLKMKASRSIFSQIIKQHSHFPFHIRNLERKVAKLGIVECAGHDLVTPYPVLFEKDGECVAHVKFTALLMPNGTLKVTGLPYPALEAHEFKDPALSALLAQSSKSNKKKKKKKPAKKAGSKPVADDGEDDQDDADEAEEA